MDKLSNALPTTVSNLGMTLKVLGGSGVIRPLGPRKLAGLARILKQWGTGPAGGFATLALTDPHRTAIVDELGELTFGEIHRRSNALSRGLDEARFRPARDPDERNDDAYPDFAPSQTPERLRAAADAGPGPRHLVAEELDAYLLGVFLARAASDRRAQR